MKRITGLKSHLNIQELLIDIAILLISKESEQLISYPKFPEIHIQNDINLIPEINAIFAILLYGMVDKSVGKKWLKSL